MKIRTSLTLKYTGITAIVLMVSMVVIYCVSEQTRSRTFYHDLRSEGVTKAHLYLSGATDAATMQSIYRNNRQFINEVEVAVYTPDYRMLYHDAANIDIVKETRSMIDSIIDRGEMEFRVGKYQGVGILYDYRGEKYVVTAAAYDGYGHENLWQLRRTLIVLFIIGLSMLFVIGYWFARLSLKPIREIVRDTEEISARHIDKRLPVKNRDEIGELASAFNALLDRLGQSFQAQKMFVGNVSHELKTPLAALTAELDLSLLKDRTPERYRSAIAHALGDARRMNELIDGLLNLAKADYQKEGIKMTSVRIDELLMDARMALLRAHPDYKIDIIFTQEPDDECLITVKANPYLLTIALSNLMDNNCKYSPDHASTVQISYWNQVTIIRLSDNGSGISEEESRKLFTLFHRGAGETTVKGHGIGMVLARKIIDMHQGSITVNSSEGYGTTFIVELPHVESLRNPHE